MIKDTWMDGYIDRKLDGQMNSQKVRKKEIFIDGQIERQIDG